MIVNNFANFSVYFFSLLIPQNANVLNFLNERIVTFSSLF